MPKAILLYEDLLVAPRLFRLICLFCYVVIFVYTVVVFGFNFF